VDFSKIKVFVFFVNL